MAIPSNTVLPAITGTVVVGDSLSVDNGTWDNVPTAFVYAWLRDGVAITGEVSNVYLLSLSDVGAVITASVTASNVDGEDTAVSAGTIAVPSTLIVEDGTVVASANSYNSLADLSTYHIGRGNSAWGAFSQGAQEGFAKQATDYMLQNFRFDWKGLRKDVAQTLDWPRVDVYLEPRYSGENGIYPYEVASTIVPEEVKIAHAILSLKASDETLNPDETQTIIREKIDVIETEFSEYSPTKKRFSSVQDTLRPYLANNGAIQLQAVRT